MIRAIVFLVIGAAAAVAVDRVLLSDTAPFGGVAAGTEPGPGDPPLIWVDGTIEVLDDSHLEVREGEGESLRLERLAAGATAFLAPTEDGWRELVGTEVDELAAGDDACIESLLDGRTVLALRVFLGAECGPSGPS